MGKKYIGYARVATKEQSDPETARKMDAVRAFQAWGFHVRVAQPDFDGDLTKTTLLPDIAGLESSAPQCGEVWDILQKGGKLITSMNLPGPDTPVELTCRDSKIYRK